MRKGVVAAIASAIGCLALTATASAATEVGNNCTANHVVTDRAAVQLAKVSPASEPLSVPAAGVLTKWRVNVVFPTSELHPLRLKVFRPLGGNGFAVIAESGTAVAGGGINVFDTRIPVAAGDRFGTEGDVLYCETDTAPGDVLGRTGFAEVGTSVDFDNSSENQLVAVTGIVEPDADHDGYGDESQDLCPISAATQSPCPPVIHQATLITKRNAVLVLLTTTDQVTATIGATVKLPRKGSARLVPVTQTVTPPTVGRFLLKLPKQVKSTLADLPKGKSLKLTARATVTDAIGRVDSANQNFKLKPAR
jgi:hypothetical protein